MQSLKHSSNRLVGGCGSCYTGKVLNAFITGNFNKTLISVSFIPTSLPRNVFTCLEFLLRSSAVRFPDT